MELKPYQQEVLQDLGRFVDLLGTTPTIPEAFSTFWAGHPRTALVLGARDLPVQPYQNHVPGAPNVCIKVPTGGGKTYLACNALSVIYQGYAAGRPRMVVWLVPSLTILTQTLGALRNPRHPYRQRLNAQFGGRVEVLDKQQLDQGMGVQAAAAGEQLTIVVMSFDSIRTKSKENRKSYQENGAHQGFVSAYGTPHSLPDTDATATINVLRALEPVVIVDESHNVTSSLSVEMLRNLRPSFVLDLTATPRPQSNIISFVNAQALKQEHMVKLPVVVYNQHEKTDVINSALALQRRLEKLAVDARKLGAPYVRPIVLFQAQPKNAADPATYQEVKKLLIKLRIPEEQIKIKTGDLDELKDTDLLSPKCPVRYIITVNALKEGWDCPFAYVLASLAARNSAVDVEQIVGRVLRQPYATALPVDMLNMSYVITASAQFQRTLASIVAGLNRAGFSEQDYRVVEAQEVAAPAALPGQLFPAAPPTLPPTLPPTTAEPEDPAAGIDESRLLPIDAFGPGATDLLLGAAPAAPLPALAEIERLAHQMAADAAAAPAATSLPPNELAPHVKSYSMRQAVHTTATTLRLPQFVVKGPGGLFEATKLLDQTHLLTDFELSKKDVDVRFDNLPADMYQIDLDENTAVPRLRQAEQRLREPLIQYLRQASPKGQLKTVVAQLADQLAPRLKPISEAELKEYLHKLLAPFSVDQLADVLERQESYARRLRDHIDGLKTTHAIKAFYQRLDREQVWVEPRHQLPERITPKATALPLTNSLYELEEKGNTLEQAMMDLLANLSNLTFWTRNPVSGGFRLNGPIGNHYPDFVVHTTKGKTVVIETKGDHLANDDSRQKLRLGEAWAKYAGRDYRYYMVFEHAPIDGAKHLAGFADLLAQL